MSETTRNGHSVAPGPLGDATRGMFGQHEISVWVVATHKVGEPIEAYLYVTKDEAMAAFEEIDFENEPLMDCKRMFMFDLQASIGWGSSRKLIS